MKRAILFVIFICCSFFCASSLCASVEDQLKALQEFYRATNGEKWKASTNWLKNEDYCSWLGIKCKQDTKNITAIELPDNDLRGTIPASIGLFTSVIVLDFSNNKITGSIPESIGNLKEMTWLLLSNNELTGTLPASLGQITGLNVIRLAANRISGTIPDSFANLKNLLALNMTRNELSGTLPSAIGKMKLLTTLHLSDNKITGADPNTSLPPYVYSCSLKHNPLSCSNPSWVFKNCYGTCENDNPEPVTAPVEPPIALQPVHEPVSHVPVTHAPIVDSPVSAPTTEVNAPVTNEAADHTMLTFVLVLTAAAVVLVTVLIVLVVRVIKKQTQDPERQGLLANQRHID